MPDITICDGKDCPLKEKCYRFTAISSGERQSWFANAPYDPAEKKCRHFSKNEEPDLMEDGPDEDWLS